MRGYRVLSLLFLSTLSLSMAFGSLLSSPALAFAPRIEEWTATSATGPTTRFDDFEDGFVPGDPSDTGDTEPVESPNCESFESGDESGGSLTFRGPGNHPSCRGPDGRRNQSGFFQVLPSGAAAVRSTWHFVVPERGELYIVQLQNVDAATAGPDPQRVYLFVNQFEGDVYVAQNDENDVPFESALVGSAASLEGFAGVIELEISLTESGLDLLPHGRFRLCSASCGDESSDPFLDLTDIPGAGDGAMNTADSHIPVITAVFDPPTEPVPAAGPLGSTLLAAALLTISVWQLAPCRGGDGPRRVRR